MDDDIDIDSDSDITDSDDDTSELEEEIGVAVDGDIVDMLNMLQPFGNINNIIQNVMQFNNNDELINEEVDRIIRGCDTSLDRYNQLSIDATNEAYLRNIHNDNDIELLIKYTIRMLFEFGLRSSWSYQSCCDAIICYTYTQNIVFNNNIEIVLRELKNELLRVLRRNMRFNIIYRINDNRINNNNIFQDVKLTLDDDKLKDIPVKKYECKENETDTCAICQDDFTKEDLVRELKCKHIYHKDCIDPWLTKQSHKCPCCRESAGEYHPEI